MFFLKIVTLFLFPRVLILSGEKMDKEKMCTTNSLDFTTEIKNVHCFGLTLTYKNSGKSDKYLTAMVDMDGERNQNYPQWKTMSE